eukprot:m.34747 g.34747  ORF g.34747 m.34747 type:complete len:81 (+) comp32007_c0_seq5:2349-2591(+)
MPVWLKREDRCVITVFVIRGNSAQAATSWKRLTMRQTDRQMSLTAGGLGWRWCQCLNCSTLPCKNHCQRAQQFSLCLTFC